MSQTKSLGNLEIASFFEQLAMIIDAGIPTYEGVSILAADAPDEETKMILQKICEPLEMGATFHTALSASGVFPQYALDMVEFGELSGHLDEVLHSLKHYYEREESLSDHLKNAMTYPFIMIGIMLAIIFILVSKVLPVFHQIYIELNCELTGFTLTLMNFANTLNQYAVPVVIGLFLIAAIAFAYTKTSAFHLNMQKRKLAMYTASSRFANCMYMTLNSGLDLTQGLDMAERLVDNPYMSARICKCKSLLANGIGFSEAILTSHIFTKKYTSMITIGFRTGSIAQVMDYISKDYEESIEEEMTHFLSILEPSLVIFMALIIGFILFSFLMPLIEIMSSLS